MPSSLPSVAAHGSNAYDAASDMLLDTDAFPPFLQKHAYINNLQNDTIDTPPSEIVATQLWKFFTKTKQRLPNQQRVENLAWRMMALNVQKCQRGTCHESSGLENENKPSPRSQHRNRAERTWDPLKLNNTPFVPFSDNKTTSSTSHWRWSGFNLDEIQPGNSSLPTPSVDSPRRSSCPATRTTTSTFTRRKSDAKGVVGKQAFKRPADESFDTIHSHKKTQVARMDLGTTPYEDMLERILHGNLPDNWNNSTSTFTSGDYPETYHDADFLNQQDFALSCSLSANQMFEIGSNLSDSSNFLINDHSSPLIPESVSSSGSDLSISFSNTTLPQTYTTTTQEASAQYLSHLKNLISSKVDSNINNFDNETNTNCSNSQDNMSADWLNTQLTETDGLNSASSLDFATGKTPGSNIGVAPSKTSGKVGTTSEVPVSSSSDSVPTPTTPKSDSPETSKVQQAPGYTPMTCVNCSTQTTPLWRRDPSGKPMCNACGLFLKLHGVLRPLSLKTNVIRKRRRGAVTKPTFGVAGAKSKGANDTVTSPQESQAAHMSVMQNTTDLSSCQTIFESMNTDGSEGTGTMDALSTNFVSGSTSNQSGPCNDILETQKMLAIDEESLTKSTWGDSTTGWWAAMPPRLGQSRCSSSSEASTPGLTDHGNWKWLTLSL